MGKTSIEWTDRSSNPLRYLDKDGKDVWACVKKSTGCAHCYSESLALRYGKGSAFTAANMRELTPYVRQKELKELLSPKKTPAGSKVFVCDMTDLFGDWVPFELIDTIFAAFALRPDVVFQVLTKRPNRMAEYVRDTGSHLRVTRCMVNFRDYTEPAGVWPLPNVWVGCSVENQQQADERIPHLLKVPAKVRFLSCEPLLGPINLSPWIDPRLAVIGRPLEIHWTITGGESGTDHRNCDPAWQADIVKQCKAAGVPVFVKQDSGHKSGQRGRIPLDVWGHKEVPC